MILRIRAGNSMGKWTGLVVGSIAGGFARYGAALAVYRSLGTAFPYGTLAVNLSGCFLIGLLSGLAESRIPLGPDAKLALITGFCGAYTTFSAFILETSSLIKAGLPWRALGNVAASVLLGFLALRLGEAAARGV